MSTPVVKDKRSWVRHCSFLALLDFNVPYLCEMITDGHNLKFALVRNFPLSSDFYFDSICLNGSEFIANLICPCGPTMVGPSNKGITLHCCNENFEIDRKVS